MSRSSKQRIAATITLALLFPLLQFEPASAAEGCEKTYVFPPEPGFEPTLPDSPATLVCALTVPAGRRWFTLGWKAGATGVAQVDFTENAHLLFSVRCSVDPSLGTCRVVSNIDSTTYYSPLAADPVFGNRQFQADLIFAHNVEVTFTLRPDFIGACPLPTSCASVLVGLGDFSMFVL